MGLEIFKYAQVSTVADLERTLFTVTRGLISVMLEIIGESHYARSDTVRPAVVSYMILNF